jgi:hypothetical protein
MELAQLARALLRRLDRPRLRLLIESNRGLLELVSDDMRRQLRIQVHAALAEQGLAAQDVSQQVTPRVVLRYLWLERPDLALEVSAGAGYRWLEREIETWKEVLFGDGALAR